MDIASHMLGVAQEQRQSNHRVQMWTGSEQQVPTGFPGHVEYVHISWMSQILHSPQKTHAMHCLRIWYDSCCGEAVMTNDDQAVCFVHHNKNAEMGTNESLAA